MYGIEKVLYKALVEEYGEDFVEKRDNGFYVTFEDSCLGLEVTIQVTT